VSKKTTTTNKNIDGIVWALWFIQDTAAKVILYSSCVQSSMFHGSETWPLRKENEVVLQWAEIRMVRWMCDVKVKDRIPSRVER